MVSLTLEKRAIFLPNDSLRLSVHQSIILRDRVAAVYSSVVGCVLCSLDATAVKTQTKRPRIHIRRCPPWSKTTCGEPRHLYLLSRYKNMFPVQSFNKLRVNSPSLCFGLSGEFSKWASVSLGSAVFFGLENQKSSPGERHS